MLTLWFQFLIGRLVTVEEDVEDYPLLPFQFLIGRLVTKIKDLEEEVTRGFNSS